MEGEELFRSIYIFILHLPFKILDINAKAQIGSGDLKRMYVHAAYVFHAFTYMRALGPEQVCLF